MAQEYAGEKTEPASGRRREEARQKGQVARSQDLASALFLLAAFVTLYLDGSRMFDRMRTIQTRSIEMLAEAPLDVQALRALGIEMAVLFASALGPLCGVLALAGIAGHMLQTGFLFTLHPITPDFNKVNPINGAKQLLSLRGVVRLLSSLLKIVAIGSVVTVSVLGLLGDVGRLGELPVEASALWTSHKIFWIAMRVVALLLFLAILDYAYQRWDHEKELRMTKQEAADEMKLMEGDPEIRKKRQVLARQMSRQRMMKMVERADVVITNPTELAVALQYDERTMRAPRVVAKGARRMAQRIRAVATLAGVPIVEKKPLAQALFKWCEVGDSVPPQLYQAVAEVLAFLAKIDREQGR